MKNFERKVTYTIAQEKGKRLRMARALTGCSRQDLYEKVGLSKSTLDTWESGRVELTQKGAEKISFSFHKLGIFCSAEWLLTGKGFPPHFMNDVEKVVFSSTLRSENFQTTSSVSIEQSESSIFLHADVKKELNFFMELHPDAISYIVQKKSSLAPYNIGDCLAGIVASPQSLIERIVILQKNDGSTLLCKLNKITDGFATIITDINHPPLETKFSKIAKIVWHRVV